MNVKQICGYILLAIAGFMSAIFAVFYIRNRYADHTTMGDGEDASKSIQADLRKLDGTIDGAIDSAGKLEEGIDVIKGTSSEIDRLNSDFERIIAEVEEQNGLARK
jgi:hypothetical protein